MRKTRTTSFKGKDLKPDLALFTKILLIILRNKDLIARNFVNLEDYSICSKANKMIGTFLRFLYSV